MKHKLFLIVFTALLSMNLQASSLREIIAENPGTCAAVGYIAGLCLAGSSCYSTREFSYANEAGGIADFSSINFFGFKCTEKSNVICSNTTPYEEIKNSVNFENSHSLFGLRYVFNQKTFYSHHSHDEVSFLIERKVLKLGLITAGMFYGAAVVAANK